MRRGILACVLPDADTTLAMPVGGTAITAAGGCVALTKPGQGHAVN